MMSELQTVMLDNQYKVLSYLGKGNMGSVYLVERKTDGKELVVKKLIFSSETGLEEKDVKEIFSREVEFLSRFDHPGLPRVYGTFREAGEDYLVLEYIEGYTLEDIMEENEIPIPVNKALKWTIEIAKILDYLHNSFEAPIVYKDLKPSNIIITPEGSPRLIDFGTSRFYNPDKDSDTHRLGTPGYAAPEQYREQSTAQSDVFSLGVILFQMLTGYDPTAAPLKFPPLNLLNPFIHSDLEFIVRKAIEKDPLCRYISAMEFKEKLEKYMGIEKSELDTCFPSGNSPPVPSKSIFNFFRGFINKASVNNIWGSLNYRVFLLFIRRFVLMLNNGFSITGSLNALIQETENRKLRKALSSIVKDVEKGSVLSDALALPGLFPALFITLVKAGEATNNLNTLFNRFLSFLEVDYKLQKKVRWVMSYSFIILGMAEVSVLYILTHIVPTYVDLFEGMDLTLPLPTRIIMTVAKATRNRYFMISMIIFILAITAIFKQYVKTRTGKGEYDRLKLSIPIFGSIYKKFVISRFCRTLALLIECKIPVKRALELAGIYSGNEFLTQKIEEISKLIDRGESISIPLARSRFFPPGVIQVIRAGEESDKLVHLLYKISDDYNRELKYLLYALGKTIECIIIIGMVLIIAFIAMALSMPFTPLCPCIK